MPAKWTRDSAAAFLESNRNFIHLRQINGRIPDPRDMSTAMLRRAASKFQLAELSRQPIASWDEVRGHRHTEHHHEPGRGPKKGWEHYTPPPRFTAMRDREFQGGGFHFHATVTRGERSAVRALELAAAANQQVSLGVIGTDDNGAPRVNPLFWRGGYNARKLLDEAGYTVQLYYARGRWRARAHLRADGQGLRSWLLNYLNTQIGYPYAWIQVFEIFRHEREQPGSRVRHGPQALPVPPVRGSWGSSGSSAS